MLDEFFRAFQCVQVRTRILAKVAMMLLQDIRGNANAKTVFVYGRYVARAVSNGSLGLTWM